MKHGWFEVVGIQTGEHKLKQRIRGLRPLIEHARGGAILDVGSAEGLIGRWLYGEARAVRLDCIEMHEPFIQMGMALRRDENMNFHMLDLNYIDVWLADGDPLLPAYEVVLCLCIVHKMQEPERVLRVLAKKCVGALALQIPEGPTVNDARSGNRPLDTAAVMKSEGFKLLSNFSYPGQHCAIWQRA